MIELGKLEPINDLRSVWPNEASDFTPWLSKEENLAQLGSAINMDIVLDEIESTVGGFSVDLYCHEDITNRKIVIENQLEDINHDHLGKIITYAAGKSAEILIWIVKHARDEHRQAVEWLNEHTDDNIGIFLIEIHLFTIGDSKCAPQFTVIERPNDWVKSIKGNNDKKDTPTKQMQFSFWEKFNGFTNSHPEFKQEFNTRKANPQHWYDISIGSALCHIRVTFNTRDNKICCGVYIPNNKELYDIFESHKDDIEKSVGAELVWERLPDKKASLIDSWIVDKDISNDGEWDKYFAWICQQVIKMKKAFIKYTK